jgi:hypothetical protein
VLLMVLVCEWFYFSSVGPRFASLDNSFDIAPEPANANSRDSVNQVRFPIGESRSLPRSARAGQGAGPRQAVARQRQS